MTPHVMCQQLVDALERLDWLDRQVLRNYAGPNPEGDAGWSVWLHRIFVGLDQQVEILEFSRQSELAAHEADRQRDVDELAAGATWPTQPEDRSAGDAWWPQGGGPDESPETD